MGRTACTEPQCLYKDALYLYFTSSLWTCSIRCSPTQFPPTGTTDRQVEKNPVLNSMVQILFWEANRPSDSQEIPRILWNPQVHHRIHKCPPPVPILNQLDLVHIPISHFMKIHLNIILPSTPAIPSGLLLSSPPPQHLYTPHPLPYTRYMPRQSNSSRFYHPKNIGWGVQIFKLLIM